MIDPVTDPVGRADFNAKHEGLLDYFQMHPNDYDVFARVDGGEPIFDVQQHVTEL